MMFFQDHRNVAQIHCSGTKHSPLQNSFFIPPPRVVSRVAGQTVKKAKRKSPPVTFLPRSWKPQKTKARVWLARVPCTGDVSAAQQGSLAQGSPCALENFLQSRIDQINPQRRAIAPPCGTTQHQRRVRNWAVLRNLGRAVLVSGGRGTRRTLAKRLPWLPWRSWLQRSEDCWFAGPARAAGPAGVSFRVPSLGRQSAVQNRGKRRDARTGGACGAFRKQP